MTGAFPSTLLVRDQLQTVAEDLGFTVDYSLEYAPQGETGWDNFANDIKDKGIKILEFIGQPANLVVLDQSFESAGYRPDVILLSTNIYDSSYKEASAASRAPSTSSPPTTRSSWRRTTRPRRTTWT